MHDDFKAVREYADRAFTAAESNFDWPQDGRPDSAPPWWVAGADYVLLIMAAKTRYLLELSGAQSIRGYWDYSIPVESKAVYKKFLYPYERAVIIDGDLSTRLRQFTAFVDLKIRPKLASILSAYLESHSSEVPDGSSTAAVFTHKSQKLTATNPLGTQLVERRRQLLADYKAAAGVKSDRAIYIAKGSIHKPDFYKWRSGKLPEQSKTTRRFEQFLLAKKKPVPR